MITVPVNEQRPITLIGGAAWWMFGLALVVIATTYFWADHRWETSTMPEFAAEVEEMSASTGGGHIWRRFGFIMLAGMGGVLVAWPNGNRVRIHGLLPWFVLALFAYSIASVTWSLEPAITLRRVLVLVFCFIGAIGVARTLGPRQVCLLCLLLPSWFLMLGVVAELAHGTFRPWVGEYRFAGTMHPNAQGYHLAIAFLAANSLRKQAGGYTGILLVWMVVMFSFLVMTKSRTAVGAAVLGAFTLWWLQTPIRFRVLTGLLGATAGVIVLYTAFLVGFDFRERLSPVVLIGRVEEASSFSGRIPIWNHVLTSTEPRMWLGHGYQTYWTEENVESLFDALDWSVLSSHSAYIDFYLMLGLVGWCMMLPMIILSLSRSLRLFGVTGDTGWAFYAVLMVAAMLYGLMESATVDATLPAFFLGVTFCQLAFFAPVPMVVGTEFEGNHRWGWDKDGPGRPDGIGRDIGWRWTRIDSVDG